MSDEHPRYPGPFRPDFMLARPYAPIRHFTSGANRNTDEGKPDYEGFLSPLALWAYGRYMQRHRRLEDGTVRASDNWQKGMPQEEYVKSLLRHFMDLWLIHRDWQRLAREDQESALCAIIFNAMGLLHELVKNDYAGWLGGTDDAAG